MRVLYLSYDGALDPLGQSQVVSYVCGLAALGHEITLLSFEKPARWEDLGARRELASRFEANGVQWEPLRYHRGLSLFTTSYDLLRAYALARFVHARAPFDVVHARSYPAALVAWRLKRACAIPFIFDMRGFYPEERVEGGIWPAGGALFRTTKALERVFYREAAHVVTLTRASLPVIASNLKEACSLAAVSVIPTCTDLDRFVLRDSVPTGFCLAYVGSLGTWYMFPEMLRLAVRAQRLFADTKILFLTNGDPKVVSGMARAAGVDMSRCACDTAPQREVAERLRAAHATFFFIRATFAKTASAATKLGESLALGLPVLINAGIGDSEETARTREVGVVVQSFADADLDSALHALRALVETEGVGARCRRVAEDEFALSDGIASYDRIYREVGLRS